MKTMLNKPSGSYVIKNQGETEIFLYDEIGSWGVTASAFAEATNGLTGDITLRINSPGGEVFDGVAIYNQLRSLDAKVKVVVDGVAASIASIIALAGDEVLIAENAMMMIHDPWSMAMGTAEDMRKSAGLLDKVKQTLITTYVNRTGKTGVEIAKAMTAETWFTAEEAVDFGLATSVSDDAPVEDARIAAMALFAKSGFQHDEPPVRDEWLAAREYAIKLAGLN